MSLVMQKALLTATFIATMHVRRFLVVVWTVGPASRAFVSLSMIKASSLLHTRVVIIAARILTIIVVASPASTVVLIWSVIIE